MIKVLFFAQLRERLQCDALDWPVTPLTINALIQQLIEEYPAWQVDLTEEKILIAVNQTVCSIDTYLKAGDEVAFFPPVTGG